MTRTHTLRIKGDESVLNRPKVALFCSVKCPGKLILDTYDLANRFRDEGVTVISGFHSPMEQECLRILLRSPHPAIWCLARGLYRQIPAKPVDCRAAVADGRLVMVTPFPDTVRHITAQTATTRNRLVADMAAAVVVAHAAPGSKMEALCQSVLQSGKPLFTFDHPANAAILGRGARDVGQFDSVAFASRPKEGSSCSI
jgi:predicted Rossmann fold nucleotide-binding protein DprA/Smf involved in DNA uptake